MSPALTKNEYGVMIGRKKEKKNLRPKRLFVEVRLVATSEYYLTSSMKHEKTLAVHLYSVEPTSKVLFCCTAHYTSPDLCTLLLSYMA